MALCEEVIDDLRLQLSSFILVSRQLFNLFLALLLHEFILMNLTKVRKLYRWEVCELFECSELAGNMCMHKYLMK